MSTHGEVMHTAVAGRRNQPCLFFVYYFHIRYGRHRQEAFFFSCLPSPPSTHLLVEKMINKNIVMIVGYML